MKKVEPGMNKANTSEIRMSRSREHQKLSHANSLEFRLVVQDWRRKEKKKRKILFQKSCFLFPLLILSSPQRKSKYLLRYFYGILER